MKNLEVAFFKDDLISEDLSLKQYVESLATALKVYDIDLIGKELDHLEETILPIISGKSLSNQGQVIFLTPQKSDMLMDQFPKIPAEVLESGYADVLLRQEEKYWPRNLLSVALKELVIEAKPKLNTHAMAYIVGSDAIAQMCAAMAMTMGFQKIALVASDLEKAEKRILRLQRKFFGIQFQLIKETELTLQPNNGSLILNTISEKQNSVLFEDLTYLNYISKEGLVVHLPVCFQANPLLQEAKHVGIETLSGNRIFAKRDFLFLKYTSRLEVPFEDFFANWQKAFETSKQD